MPQALGPAIVARRDSKGLSQERLAAAAGITRAALSDIERGKTSDPRRETLERIARALGCPADELLGRVDGLGYALAQARRDLPTAPQAVLRRYMRLIVEIELATDELTELRQLYGSPSEEPSSQWRGADS